MMKVIHNTCLFAACLLLVHCGQSETKQTMKTAPDTTLIGSTTKSVEILPSHYPMEQKPSAQLFKGFKKATLYALTDTISADFNGDGVNDQAFYKKENGTSGIVIREGKTNQEHRIGFGESFAHLTEFDWIDYWGLVEDKETNETTFSEDGDVVGDREVKLENPSIVVGAEELGGGLITYLNGQYVWIHQTC